MREVAASIRLLFSIITSPKRWRRTYVRYLRDARITAKNMVDAAHHSASLIRKSARDEVAKAVAEQIEITRRDVTQQVQAALLAKGLPPADLERLKDAALTAAFNAVIAEVGPGLVEPKSIDTIKELLCHSVDELVPKILPNIYDPPDRCILRVLHNNRLEYHQRVALKPALLKLYRIQLVLLRNTFIDQSLSSYRAVYDDCLIRTYAHHDGSPDFHVLVAQLFHRQLLSLPCSSSMAFVGQDPAYRFENVDPFTYTMSAFELFRDDSRIMNGLAAIGLKDRTVRDLLLVTPQELLAAPSIGNARLREVRRRLALVGLALWSDPVPSQSDNRAGYVGRQHRQLNFDS